MHILAAIFLDFLGTSDKFRTLRPLPGAILVCVFERKWIEILPPVLIFEVSNN